MPVSLTRVWYGKSLWQWNGFQAVSIFFMIRTKSKMVASKLIKTYFYCKVPMHSSVFDPWRLFADRDDSADALGPVWSVHSPTRHIAASAKCLFTDQSRCETFIYLTLCIAAIVKHLFTNPAYRSNWRGTRGNDIPPLVLKGKRRVPQFCHYDGEFRSAVFFMAERRSVHLMPCAWLDSLKGTSNDCLPLPVRGR